MGANACGKTGGHWLAFDQGDSLTTKIVLGIAAVGSVLFGVGRFVVGAATNVPLAVSYATKVTGGIDLPRGASHDGFATMDLPLRDATLGKRLGQALPELLLTAMTIVVAWVLFQLLLSTQAPERFSRRNVRFIGATALIVGIGGALLPLAQAFADNAIYGTGRLPHPATLLLQITPLPLVVTLVIAFFGEVFRRGVVLRRDVEGLV
jgi:Protein of unknown function (DUF2975)